MTAAIGWANISAIFVSGFDGNLHDMPQCQRHLEESHESVLQILDDFPTTAARDSASW